MINKFIFVFFLISTSILISQNKVSYNGTIKTAKMLERQGNIESAISIYKDILKKNPTHYQSSNNLKKLYKNNQKYSEGIDFIRGQLIYSPNNTRLYLDLGEFYHLDDQKKQARATWFSGLEKFKSNKSYYRILVTLLGSYDKEESINIVLLKGREIFGKSFLAYEAGVYHQSKRMYALAMDQFILNLLYEKNNNGMAERRILLMSDNEDAQNIIEKKLILMVEKSPGKILNILSQYYFKQQKYNLALEAKKKLTSLGNKDFNSWLKIASDLNKENEFEHATSAYKFILSKKLNSKLTERALLGLAKTFENQITPSNQRFLIPYFYNDNLFFEDQFTSPNTISLENLKSSIQMYDTLMTSIKNIVLLSEVYFRIGEVQFTILQDFDKALDLFQKALESNPKSILSQKIRLRIADSFIAKGDLIKARQFLYTEQEKNPSNGITEKILLLDLFTEKPDSTIKLITSFLSEIKPTNPIFNDLMELNTILTRYNSKDSENDLSLQHFLKSEFFVRQKKIGDAIKELIYITEHYPESNILPFINLRLSTLYYKIGKFKESIQFSNKLKNTEFEDRGIILIGQIYEIKLSNIDKALESYMRLIDDYPNSIYFEPIRYHIRKIQEVKKI